MDCVEGCGREARRDASTCRSCYKKLWIRERRAQDKAERWQAEYQWRDYVSLDKAQGELDRGVAEEWWRQRDVG